MKHCKPVLIRVWACMCFGIHALLCIVLSHFSHVWLCATPWTVAHQAPLSMGFSRQNYWRALPSPPPGDLPDLGIKPASLMCPALADRFFTASVAWEATPCIIMGPQNSCNGTVLILHFFFLWAQLATTGLALVSFFFPPHGEVSPHEHKGYTRELECSAFS